MTGMALGFSGDVAHYYAKFRRGYPPEVLEVLTGSFELGHTDTVLDLGCGTGQLTVPLAGRVGAVIGMDPEPDMLRHAREAAARQDAGNVTWVLGADTDVPALGKLLGGRALAAAVIGQALHWMRHATLFGELLPLLRPGGGIAVVANGAPAWLQDSDWSRALRGFLEEHFDTELRDTCGTAERDRLRYARALEAAGFEDVATRHVSYVVELSLDEVVGGVFSALPEDLLPAPGARAGFTARAGEALGASDSFTEHVDVSVLTARAPGNGKGPGTRPRT